MKMRKSTGLAAAAASAAWLLCAAAQAGQASRFHLEETTIAEVHRAIRAKQLTATQLVQHYFKRIEAYNEPASKAASMRRPDCSWARSRRSKMPDS